ncbi:MAG: hypothetical protein HQ567_14330 [Candidatus Nealsonbacteria bacterium]|nr:hypothetical protein [Candidatus Nealsonbacteria bacterium]
MPKYLVKLSYLRARIIKADSAERAKEIADSQMASWLTSSQIEHNSSVRVTPHGIDSYMVVKHAAITQEVVADSPDHAKAIVDVQFVSIIPVGEEKHWELTIEEL